MLNKSMILKDKNKKVVRSGHLRKDIVKANHYNNQARQLLYTQSDIEELRKARVPISTKSIYLQLLKTDLMTERRGKPRIYHRLKTLGEIVKSAKRLQELRLLSTLNFKLTDELLFLLRKVLDKALHLQTLHLAFCSMAQITEVGLANICKSLGRLTLLRNLSLCLMNCPERKILRRVSKSLERLGGLRDVNLSFSECNKVDDGDMSSVGKAFKRLRFLREIRLEFSRCKKITDKRLENLSGQLIGLSSLKRITLNFYDCQEITEEGRTALKKSIKKLRGLEKVVLDYFLIE